MTFNATPRARAEIRLSVVQTENMRIVATDGTNWYDVFIFSGI